MIGFNYLTRNRSGGNVRDTSLVMVVGRNERDMLGIEIVCVRPSKRLDSTFGTSRDVSKKNVLDPEKWNRVVVLLKFIL